MEGLILLMMAALGVIPATIAAKKGNSFFSALPLLRRKGCERIDASLRPVSAGPRYAQ
jgi:hypothetical protein